MKNLKVLLMWSAIILTTQGRAMAEDALWKSGPALNVGRYSFPMIQLPSGQWLIAGGVSSSNPFSTSAEILSSDFEAWTSISSMPSAHRGSDQAVRLLTGEVLIAGDDPHFGGHPHPRSAYRYSETAGSESGGTWTRTSNDPVVHRFLATVTLLPDGRVLFAGGYNGHSSGPTYNNAEVYDPGTDTWSATGSMAEVRTGHTATLLTRGPNAGKVLVTGGSDRAPSNTATTGCEIYDPSDGTWSATGSLNESRSLHTATLLPTGQVLAIGGQRAIGATNRETAEIYDPLTGTWSLAASLAGPRALHTATLLPSGEIIIVGGSSGPIAANPLASAEIYDPTADEWSAVAPMATARRGHSAALIANDRVIFVGGINDDGYLQTTEILYLPLLPVELMSFSIE